MNSAEDIEIKTNALVQLLIAWISAACRWLISSLSGCLIVLVILYGYLRARGPITPLSLEGLLQWITECDHPTRLAIGGWTLTMLGFLVAFWTTSATWRRHKELELRIEAAKEVHTRFQRALNRLLGINAYLKLLLLACDNARQLAPGDSTAVWHLSFPNSQVQLFQTHRAELDTAALEIKDLLAGYSTVFDNVLEVPSALEAAERTLLAIQLRFWSLNAPHCDPTAPDFVTRFLDQCDDALFKRILAEGENAHEVASTLAGFARGRLLRQVVPANLGALWRLSRNFQSMVRAVGTLTQSRRRFFNLP